MLSVPFVVFVFSLGASLSSANAKGVSRAMASAMVVFMVFVNGLDE